MTSYHASRRSFLKTSGATITTVFAATAGKNVFAQSPVEQLRILVPNPPGSVPDTVSRMVAGQISASGSQRALVDNRPGASGAVAVNALKTGAADGSVVLLAPGSYVSAYPYLTEKPAYDSARDLKPVSLAAEGVIGLAVGPVVPASVGTVRELLDWMRANPKLANVASPGVGSPPHLFEAMLFRKADVQWQHIGYAGGPPAIAALQGGQVAALALGEGILRSHHAAGKLRVLATSGAQRSRILPEVKTLAEQGFPDLVVADWFAFFMPGDASAAAIEATSAKLRTALASPALATALTEFGMVAVSSTPAALASRIAADQRIWERVIRENGIKID